jgi:hypothetical protein
MTFEKPWDAEYNKMVTLISREMVKGWINEDDSVLQSLWLGQQVKVSVENVRKVKFLFYTTSHKILKT